MLAERLSRSRSRSLGRDLEPPNSHVVGAEKVFVSPSGSATSSSLSSLSSLPSSSRSSPILINSDSPQKVDPPKDNGSNRSSPIELSPTSDDDRLNKPSRATAKAPPVPTWKTGEEKRGGKRPVSFKKASYGVNGKGGKSTVPYAKELMESHPPFKLKPRLSQLKSSRRALSCAEKHQEKPQGEIEAVTTSTVATRVSKYKNKAPKISGPLHLAAHERDADLSSEENEEVAESSFINPREKFGSGVIREVGLKRLLDDDDGDDDLPSKSSRSTPKRGRFMQSPSPGIEKTECQMCEEPLPANFLDTWKNGEFRKGHIPMLEWMDICTEHKAVSLREEWMEKGYPKIDWQGMKKRIETHYKPIEAIVHGEIESPFMAIFQQQEKDVRGNPILLLQKDHRLQYPGYYGPRGANIMLHWLLRRFGSEINAHNNATSNLAHSSAAAFVQAVLVPEMAVRLIMEDMKVAEKRAREVLEESRSIGETLNLKDYQEDIYGTGDNWVDVNNFKN
ncbi:RTC4-like domain-domain-containing protein [Tuber borchii]|uniref:Restriction of telomere capping protein 4 n=1 Tax=Tuber borchii TaxID=42251 RepID=A0A2T7A079_TUBBO|nr:RTC4-like domain-domain-containing protein [Tuber borchii]